MVLTFQNFNFLSGSVCHNWNISFLLFSVKIIHLFLIMRTQKETKIRLFVLSTRTSILLAWNMTLSRRMIFVLEICLFFPRNTSSFLIKVQKKVSLIMTNWAYSVPSEPLSMAGQCRCQSDSVLEKVWVWDTKAFAAGSTSDAGKLTCES